MMTPVPSLLRQQREERREPVVSVSSIHVEENSGVVITNSSLSVQDGDTPENEVVFTIIRKPSYGERHRLKLTLALRGRPPSAQCDLKQPKVKV